jgi:hypothetical protein
MLFQQLVPECLRAAPVTVVAEELSAATVATRQSLGPVRPRVLHRRVADQACVEERWHYALALDGEKRTASANVVIGPMGTTVSRVPGH